MSDWHQVTAVSKEKGQKLWLDQCSLVLQD